MSSSPLQFVNAHTYPLLPSTSPLRDCSKLRRPICASMRQQRPGHTRHLVGKCHRHDLEGSSRQEPREPGIFLRVLLGAPQDGMCADDENASQIAVALLGDRTELLLAPGRILSRHQPNPSREVTTRSEDLRVRDRGNNGGRAHQTNPRDAPEPLACFVRAMLSNNPLLD